jgi:hypothetical protein
MRVKRLQAPFPKKHKVLVVKFPGMYYTAFKVAALQKNEGLSFRAFNKRS